METILGNAMVIAAYKLERNISKQVDFILISQAISFRGPYRSPRMALTRFFKGNILISNRFIVSLAVSDLIIGIEGYPLFTLYVLNGDHWPLGWIACETWLFLDYTLCLVSILTVLLITADRYLSVCHTASYIKWQSPAKAQMTIICSWLIPALIFGFMIYGWSLVSNTTSGLINGECVAPFLTNPYVNMSLYVVYYWTTLIAMLILYKGIHKVTKKLEKKAGAKDQRQLALLFSQQLGTQVGLKLMLSQTHNADSDTIEENVHIADAKDADYRTFTTNVTDSNERYGLGNVDNLSIAMSEESADTIIFNNVAMFTSNSGIHQAYIHTATVSLDHAEEEFNQNSTARHALYCPSADARQKTLVSERFTMKWVSQIKNQVTRTLFNSKSSSSLSTTSSVEVSSSKAPATQSAGLNIPAVTRHGRTSRNENNSKQNFMTSTAFNGQRSRKLSFSSLNIKRDNVMQFFSPFTLLRRKRKQTKAERRAHKAFRTITFIVGCFAILWSPYYVVATVYGFCRHCIPSLLYTLTYYMCYLNSSSNPFAYALANRQFRVAFLRMLRRDFNKNS
uniref:G_PROTEIN_RECEP_F1_2 domain-containing protein n=1 Tax=Loa loa TaxID=7209 RepID=A0A1I7W124_LOALO